jgi:hypothetical protein
VRTAEASSSHLHHISRFFLNTDMMAQPRENGMPDSEKSREEKTPNGRAGFMQLAISMKLGGSLNGGERENDV